jgi:hypothetical protein
MRVLKEFGVFWYDFIIGDDWKIAVAVVLALASTLVLLELDVFSDHVVAILGSALIIAFFTLSLVIDVRKRK